MRLIFIHGPAAAGKLTVGRALQQLTGLPLFHNHLVVDALLAVFPFGSEPFVRLREQTWLAVFEAAAREGTSLIFTFTPEATVDPGFIARTQACVPEICFVELSCPVEELERRIGNVSRAEFRKLRSVELFREGRAKNAHLFPSPPPGLIIDTSLMQPDEAARTICDFFGL